MNRRSILSTLCTGALALLAPVVAWAKPRRWVGFHNRGVKPMVITPHGVVDAQHYEALGREHIRARANNILLRALLAEARDTLSVIRAEVIDTYAESDEWPVRQQPPEWWNHYRRMADATLDRMKGHERNA